MKKLLVALSLIATPALATQAIMYRDPGCGCCELWAAQVRQAFGRSVSVVDAPNRPALQQRLGMPPNLNSCHTAIIDGMVFEGHVPIADMRRVLATKPRGVRGLAVAGMPMGSPGMEVAGRPADNYNVIAFGTVQPYIYARH